MNVAATNTITVFPGTGECYSLDRVEDAAALSHRCSEAMGVLRRMKERADDALRDELGRQAVTIMAAGEFEVSETTGAAKYDGEVLYNGLIEAGIAKDVVVAMFEPKLRDAKELGKLERRNDAVAKAAEAARTRSRGYVKVSPRKGHAPAPIAPAEIQQKAREVQQLESDAESLGI